MQFTPKTEAQINEESLLPEGIYPFAVQSAQDKISKSSGKPMIEVKLEVFDEAGRTHFVTDYLMESMAYKLIHFAQTTGLTKEYEAGNMPADIMQGRSGKVKIRKEDAQGDYRAKNSVKDYVKPDPAQEVAAPAPRVPDASKAPGGADDVPFMRLGEFE